VLVVQVLHLLLQVHLQLTQVVAEVVVVIFLEQAVQVELEVVVLVAQELLHQDGMEQQEQPI
jgi:hypothetical protein